MNFSVPAGAFDPATGRAEVTIPSGIVLQVQSASSWQLQMRATGATFMYVTQPGAGIAKPVAELQVRRSTGGSRIVSSTSYVVVASGKNTSGWDEYAFDVILQATSNDAGGVYTVNLEFNII